MAESKNEMSTNWILPTEVDLQKCEKKLSPYVIRVLNEAEKREAMRLIMGALFIFRDCPVVSALKFDAVSTAALVCWIKLHLDQNIVFGCFHKEKVKYKLVAVDVLYVRNIRDAFPEPSMDSGEAFLNLMKYIKRIEAEIWSKGAQKICNILASFGVFASREFKNNSRIIKAIITNRKRLAQELHITVLGRPCLGKTTDDAKKEALTYEVVHIFQREDSEKLGLDNIEDKDLKKIFPITVMGAKVLPKKDKSDGEKMDEARRKKIKTENDDK